MYPDEFFELDLDSATYRRIGTTAGIGGIVTQLAAGTDGRYFGIANTDPAGVQVLFSIEPVTGTIHFTREVPFAERVGALAFGPGGFLWVTWRSDTRELRNVDPETGATLGSVPLAEDVGLLSARDEDLFGWIREGEGRYTLAEVDPATGGVRRSSSIDLEGADLVGSDFDRHGDLRLMAFGIERRFFLAYRYYRMSADGPAEVVRPELTAEDVYDKSGPNRPNFFTFAIQRGAGERRRASGARPAASLLVPYFEVDLEAGGGRDTIVSIDNAGSEPVLANVVLWTDWGVPSFAFNLLLEPDGVRVVDARVLEGGRFDGGTEVLVWTSRSPVGGRPSECGRPPDCPIRLVTRSRVETGGQARLDETTLGRQTARLSLGDGGLPVAGRFGSLHVRALATAYGCGDSAVILEHVQSWVASVTSAGGRFSAAVEAADLGGTCN